jgi:hypothetical protein
MTVRNDSLTFYERHGAERYHSPNVAHDLYPHAIGLFGATVRRQGIGQRARLAT